MELTGATSNQLQYLERSGLIKPMREWKGKKKPNVYYNWQQILEVRVIRNLRKTTSLQVIRKILDFFEGYKIDKSLRDKQIIAINEEVFLIDCDWSNFAERISALKLADRGGKGIGQYTLLVVPALRDIVNEIWDVAERSKIIAIEDFKSRAKMQPSKRL
ncbi:MerR family transcriptional regulator [Nostoc sp. DedQUE09]|uniref:MerR family transcriptional regulator n=1 Tax=Nostoc sp. DedQUE09 TaxID=3075394 RepID=UPI002AD4B10B|nr:MerR family transcriptional regulator [Nostoc sp. DedQUE09]MDZ7952441.1 MerR family transcriptional regulator [Nostoc sp. DedQUE09]